jgi:hypothetical protein
LIRDNGATPALWNPPADRRDRGALSVSMIGDACEQKMGSNRVGSTVPVYPSDKCARSGVPIGGHNRRPLSLLGRSVYEPLPAGTGLRHHMTVLRTSS